MNALANTGVAQTAAGVEGSVGIEGIDAITYSTDGTQKNWDDTRRFFADWGLKPLADDAEKQVWETLNGAQVVVRKHSENLYTVFEKGCQSWYNVAIGLFPTWGTC